MSECSVQSPVINNHSTNIISILKRFRDSYISFIDELMQLFPDEVKLIPIRVFFVDQIPVQMVADQFIKYVLPHKKQIISKDEHYFINNDNIFNMMGDKNGDVLHFKKLWTSDRLDDEDREAIWKYFFTFIVLIEKYKQLKDSSSS